MPQTTFNARLYFKDLGIVLLITIVWSMIVGLLLKAESMPSQLASAGVLVPVVIGGLYLKRNYNRKKYVLKKD